MSLIEKRYEILRNDSTEGLQADVNERLNAGWELHGPLLTYAAPEGQIFVQAVVYVPKWR